MRHASPAAVVSILLTVACAIAEEWTPPAVVLTRKAYEAQYPKSSASAAAREVEALAAGLGIDAAPKDESRNHPSAELALAYQRIMSPLGQYVDGQLGEPGEEVGAPNEAIRAYLGERAATIESVRGVLTGRREVAWEVDIGAGPLEAPGPNVLGLLRLTRALAATAMLDIRSGDQVAALGACEAIWRLAQNLAGRPDLVSHMVALSQARLVVGLLRKIDSVAPEWADRLRGRSLFDAFLSAFQNDPWIFADEPEIAAVTVGMARIHRRFVDGLSMRNPCEWTPESLSHAWDVAVSAEPGTEEILATIASETGRMMLVRWHRFLVDAELTSLVLEARFERAASRDGEWPVKLWDLASVVCPGRAYEYSRGETISIAFQWDLPAVSGGLVLPSSFRSANRPPPLTPTPTSTAPPGSDPTPVHPHPAAR
jgi:hypothetical protein